MNKRIYGLIGICQKAGKLVSGELACELAIKKDEAYLVILAEDASKNTNKKFNDKCQYRNVPLIEFGTKESLGNAIGKMTRAAIAVTDEKLAGKIAELIKQSTQ